MEHYEDLEDITDWSHSASTDALCETRYAESAKSDQDPWGKFVDSMNKIRSQVDWDGIRVLVERHSTRGRGESLRDQLVRERDELETALSVIAKKLTRRTEQISHLDRYPDVDPFEDGTILRFEKRFPNGEKTYSYVATRADGLWYLTGARSPQGTSWDEFVDFMGLGVD